MDPIHDNIKLNPTHGTNDKVNFLDVSITRNPTFLELDIYRKPTVRRTLLSTFSPTTLSSISSRPIDSL